MEESKKPKRRVTCTLDDDLVERADRAVFFFRAEGCTRSSLIEESLLYYIEQIEERDDFPKDFPCAEQ